MCRSQLSYQLDSENKKWKNGKHEGTVIFMSNTLAIKIRLGSYEILRAINDKRLFDYRTSKAVKYEVLSDHSAAV